MLTVNPGDRIVVDTRDAFSGRINTEVDKPREKARLPFDDPQNGSIMIEGVAPGDALAVNIEEMLPHSEQPRGTCSLIPKFGALTGTYYTATLNQPLPEIVRKILVDKETVHWRDKVKLPYRPHISILSCAPDTHSRKYPPSVGLDRNKICHPAPERDHIMIDRGSSLGVDTERRQSPIRLRWHNDC
jgi:amidase